MVVIGRKRMRFVVAIVLVMVTGLAIACGSAPAVSENNKAAADSDIS